MKTLCELKKLLKTDLPQFLGFTSDPTHLCRRCGRVANDKRLLCKPIRIEKIRRRATETAVSAEAENADPCGD